MTAIFPAPKHFLLPALAVLLAFLPDAECAVSKVLLRSGTDASGHAYQLLRLRDDAGTETFALWLPPTPDVGSAVLITEPYTGIDWTGLALDQTVASLPDAKTLGYIDDIFGPLYSPGQSRKISYFYKAPEDVIGFAQPFLLNGIGALFVFERFYAGHSIEASARETAVGLEFLGTHAAIDSSRVGIFGASWGGFEALHGAAHAAAAFKPRYGVAWQPMVDFQRFWNDITRDYYLRFAANPASQNLVYLKLEPYARRVAVSAWNAAAGKMDFSRYGLDFLKANLKTEFLILHDEWDTLVPVEHSLDLARALPATQTSSFIVPRATPIDYSTFTVDHFPVKSTWSFDNWGAIAMAYGYLIDRLADPAAPYLISFYDGKEFAALLLHLKSMKAQGRSIASLAPRLLDLCQPKLWLYNVAAPGEGVLPGTVIVSAYLNAVFGLTVSPENVQHFLLTNGI